MTLQNEFELKNTRKKLRELEEYYATREKEPSDNDYFRELTLQSLKRLINQLKEEIMRYEAHASPPGRESVN